MNSCDRTKAWCARFNLVHQSLAEPHKEKDYRPICILTELRHQQEFGCCMSNHMAWVESQKFLGTLCPAS